MKFSLTLGLLSVFVFAACEADQPPVRPVKHSAKYPTPTPQAEYPPAPQPFPTDGTQPANPPPSGSDGTETLSAPVSAAPQAAKGDYPYGVPVPGKPGFVRSPYSPDKMTDVRGYAPGTEVKDPYTQKIFLVP